MVHSVREPLTCAELRPFPSWESHADAVSPSLAVPSASRRATESRLRPFRFGLATSRPRGSNRREELLTRSWCTLFLCILRSRGRCGTRLEGSFSCILVLAFGEAPIGTRLSSVFHSQPLPRWGIYSTGRGESLPSNQKYVVLKKQGLQTHPSAKLSAW